jgi:MFS superfamily sulfate permease-like transporter
LCPVVVETILSLPNIPDGDITSPEVSAALVSAALALTFLVGLTSLLLGLVRLGFLDSILSKPMLAGFVLAVAATLICEQLPVLFGLNDCGAACKPGVLPIEMLIYTLGHLPRASWITLLMSISCCTFMFLFAFLKKRFHTNRVLLCIPDVLVVVVFSTLTSYCLSQSHD